jgi:hypothetical protein
MHYHKNSGGSDDDDYDINWKFFVPVAELIHTIIIIKKLFQDIAF